MQGRWRKLVTDLSPEGMKERMQPVCVLGGNSAVRSWELEGEEVLLRWLEPRIPEREVALCLG